MCDEAIIEGVVTDVDEKLLTFEVDTTTTIHMGLLFAKNHTKLPVVGATVKVSSRFFNTDQNTISSMILTDLENDFETDLSVTASDKSFVQILNDLSLSPEDLLHVAKNYDNLKKYLSLVDTCRTEIILSVLRKLQNCRFDFEFLNQKQFVDHNLEVYKNYSYWTFGNHWNWYNESNTKYLIGFLKVCESTGRYIFTDSRKEIPCLLLNKTDFDVKKILNLYILIKDYTFVTEIYNSNKVCLLDYLLVDINEIINLDVGGKVEETKHESEGYRRMCTIISKSLPMLTSPQSVSYWLEVIQENKSRAFLRLDSSHLDIYSFLKTDHSYEVCFKSLPTKTYNKELFKTNSSLLQLKLSSDSRFTPKHSETPKKILNTCEAIRSLISSELISFEGTISLKKFVNPLGSRTASLSQDRNFGTPGSKTHVVEFQTDGKPLVLYLNNWENLAVPYGLIPNMRVIVYNVKPQSRSYYKSTVMTSIEVVRYEPKIKFETAILCGNDWGVPFPLSVGSLIPNGTIIYAKALSLFVLGLKIHVEKINEEIYLKTQITLIVVDQSGESKVIAKDTTGLLLLRLLLKLYEPAFKKWCQSFCLDQYVYYKGMPKSEEKKSVPQYILTEYLKALETHSCSLYFKCRKMDDEVSGKPVYFFLDGHF